MLAPEPSDSASEQAAGGGSQRGGTTGITVSVGGCLRPRGVSQGAYAGVAVIVLDQHGNTATRATMQNEIDSDFIALTPGRYVLRLDIGKVRSSAAGTVHGTATCAPSS